MVRILVRLGLRKVLLLGGASSDWRCDRQCDELDSAGDLPPFAEHGSAGSDVQAAAGRPLRKSVAFRPSAVNESQRNRPDATAAEAGAATRSRAAPPRQTTQHAALQRISCPVVLAADAGSAW